MHPVRFAVLAAALALAACAHARKPEVALPAAYESLPPTTPAVAASAQPIDRWWTRFGDAQLDGLIEHALTANPDARSAAARLREARATALSGLTVFLPQGDAAGSAEKTHTKQIAGTVFSFPGFSTGGTSEQDAANLNVSWEVDLFGRIFAASRVARADVAAARFDYEAARWALAAQVADAYFQAKGLAIQLADARETVRIEQELYDLAVRRGRAGLSPTSDADRVAGDLAQARAQAEDLAAQLQAERRQLLILAGRPIEPTASLDLPPAVGVLPLVPASLPSQLLARRPDVREAHERMAAAAGQLTLADLAFFPTLNFTPGVGWQKIVQPGFSATTESWTVGFRGTQPVFSIPKLMADLKAQDARTEQAVIAYEKAVQTAFGEAEAALVRLDADRRRAALLSDGEVRARRAYEASRLGYERGLTDLQTALSAEQAWRGVRTQLTGAEVAGLRQAVAAFKAIGGGWPAGTRVTGDSGQDRTSKVTRP